jgi:ParB-like chromosome segregation protein Spo0J
MLRNFRPDLLIEWVSTRSLRCAPFSPREHPDRQVKQIGWSIGTFGFLVPILIDNDGNIIAGDARLRAAEKIGMLEVPVIRISHLTEAEKRAFQVADNRLTEHAKWNDRLLAETLKDLSALDLDFSLEVTGFSIAEIDLRIEGLSASASDAPDPADQVPSPAQSGYVHLRCREDRMSALLAEASGRAMSYFTREWTPNRTTSRTAGTVGPR